jgi:hypothetical protein
VVGGGVVGLIVVAVEVGVALGLVVAGLVVARLVVAGLEADCEGRAVAEDVAVAEWLTAGVRVFGDIDEDGEKIAGSFDDGVPVHAATVSERRTIRAAQPRSVSRALPAVPAGVMRAFMRPP